jgi:hypothetical protein
MYLITFLLIKIHITRYLLLVLNSTGNITTDIRAILQQARQIVVSHTNTAMTAAY